MGIYLRILRYLRPFWPLSLAGIVLTLAAIGLNLLKPWPFKYIVDGILAPESQPEAARARTVLEALMAGATPWQQVLALCAVLVIIHLAWGVVNMAANFCFLQAGLRALLKLRTDLYACLQSLPLKYHDARRSADSSFRVAYDSQSLQTIYNRGFAGVFGALVTLVSALAVMAIMNAPLALASLAVLPLVAGAIRFYAERVRRESAAIQERESDLLAVTQEGLSQIRMVHAFGREQFEVRQFRRRAARSLEANMRLNLTSLQSTLVVGTLMALGTALMYAVGSAQVMRGALSLGDLLVFASYLLMLYQPIEQLSYTAWALEGAAAGATRCFEVLDAQNDVPDLPGAAVIQRAHGAIAFRQVHFSYDQSRPILQGISLEISPGETVALVGGTGAGKSTLLSLVPRFYDPTEGRVELDGRDLRSITKKSLRAQIAIVLQDTLLFSTTVRENISYGRPGAKLEEIIEAAKLAQAHDFIMSLPGGYDAQVGERGSRLSVGQRQRIGIARAFLKNAPILLLDEPTSALDPATEAAIMETLSRLMAGRTTLIVTHRLATVHHLGRVVVLEGGRVVEHGRGPELLARGGVYARLFEAGKYSSP